MNNPSKDYGFFSQGWRQIFGGIFDFQGFSKQIMPKEKECFGTTPPHSGCQSSSGIFHFFRFGNHDLNLPLRRWHPGSRGGWPTKCTKKKRQAKGLDGKWTPIPYIHFPYNSPLVQPVWEVYGEAYGKNRGPTFGTPWGYSRMNISKLGIADGPCSQGKVWKLSVFTPFWVKFLRGEKLRRCSDQTKSSPVWEFPQNGSEVRIRESDPQNGLETLRLRIYNHKLPSNCPDVMMNSPTKSC